MPPHFWEDYPALLAADGGGANLLERAERGYAECRDHLQAAGVALPEGLSLEEALELGRSPRT